MKQMRELPEQTKYDLALRIYDLMQYQDHRSGQAICGAGRATSTSSDSMPAQAIAATTRRRSGIWPR